MDLNIDFLIIFSIILFFSSLVQGSIGFGFPLISTPLLAMITDMKTAILYVAIPTLLINLIAIFSEGNFLSAIKRFYPLAIFAMIGSAIGTQILIYSSSEIFKLLLAISIIFYILIQKFKFEMVWVKNKPKISLVIFGLSAGIIGGLTNVMALVLIIYSLESKHSRKEIIQSSNICFLFGKLIQIILFAIHGSFTQELLTISFSSLILVVVAMVIGLKIKKKIPQENYNKVIKGFLFLMAIALIYQTIF
ncbi:sulfite exporter TauE/SafE family protein [Aliarcobacter butzleri]|uniref:sulfite exporter TauE/SafE family protein n=1 Tax=Aliarcobacter butzleri TaxID=28197 RepID=UPI00125EF9AB|nr:sulfite exporter TauE/SafE family protein [Aliarcobacter butzleri]